jgi:hypothetical protein
MRSERSLCSKAYGSDNRLFFQGFYRLTNLTFHGNILATRFDYELCAELKLVVRVQGAKRNVPHSSIKAIVISKANPQSLITVIPTFENFFKVFQGQFRF